MILTSKELSQLVGMSRFGFQKLVKNLNIPYKIVGNRFIFDTNSDRFKDFFTSVNMAYTNPGLKVFYSLKDLAEKRQQHKDTIRTFLIEHDIKIYRSGRKWLVLLIDLQRFQQLMQKNGN